jgi:hypothetical protein
VRRGPGDRMSKIEYHLARRPSSARFASRGSRDSAACTHSVPTRSDGTGSRSTGSACRPRLPPRTSRIVRPGRDYGSEGRLRAQPAPNEKATPAHAQSRPARRRAPSCTRHPPGQPPHAGRISQGGAPVRATDGPQEPASTGAARPTSHPEPQVSRHGHHGFHNFQAGCSQICAMSPACLRWPS